MQLKSLCFWRKKWATGCIRLCLNAGPSRYYSASYPSVSADAVRASLLYAAELAKSG